jgi:hypothetical protein
VAAPALAEKVPGAQALQPPAATVPGLVTAPKKPGAQAVHAATLALPICW